MAEQNESRIAPPPRGQGLPDAPARGSGASPSPGLVIPPNQFGQLVKTGFGLGIGIALAFAAIGAVFWFVVLALIAVAAS